MNAAVVPIRPAYEPSDARRRLIERREALAHCRRPLRRRIDPTQAHRGDLGAPCGSRRGFRRPEPDSAIVPICTNSGFLRHRTAGVDVKRS
jgi:hypothetical protein